MQWSKCETSKKWHEGCFSTGFLFLKDRKETETGKHNTLMSESMYKLVTN